MKANVIYKIITSVLLLTLCGCSGPGKKSLVVFAAGSLIQPFSQLEAAFEAENPEIDVVNEFHGSIQVMRHVTDIHEKIDLVATADHNLIPSIMFETKDPETGKPYSDWYIEFATNRLALAYTDHSRFADEINEKNWFEILLRPDVRIGLADPRFDAAGYRSLMLVKLSEEFYQRPALLFDMFHSAFKTPIKTSEKNNKYTIHIPEILETKPGSRIVVRGGSIQLNSLLEAGEIDYAFEYESVIKQLGFRMVSLPPQINLGSPPEEVDYSEVEVMLDFQRFASVFPEFQGEQIGYGLTIPTNAQNPDLARRYIEFLFSPKGKKIMESNNHPLLVPLKGVGFNNIPIEIREFVSNSQ